MIRALVEMLRAIHCPSGVGLPGHERRALAAKDFREAAACSAEVVS